MKRFFIAASVLALSFVSCNQAPKSTDTTAVEVQATAASDLAYVNIDRVLVESEIYKSEGVALQQKTEKAQKGWAQKEQNLQNEAVQLQQKYQKGLITSSNAQQQQQSIEKRAASFQQSTQGEAQKLEEENYVFSNRAQDLINRAIKEINSDKSYKMIVNSSALIDADTTIDISLKVLDVVNRLYSEESKK